MRTKTLKGSTIHCCICHCVLGNPFCKSGWLKTKGRLEFTTDSGGCWRCKNCGHKNHNQADVDGAQRWCDERFGLPPLRRHADNMMGLKAPDELICRDRVNWSTTWVKQQPLVSDRDCRGLEPICACESEDDDHSISQGIEPEPGIVIDGSSFENKTSNRWQRASRKASSRSSSSSSSSTASPLT